MIFFRTLEVETEGLAVFFGFFDFEFTGWRGEAT
jgi:hypothetical protein